LQKDYAGKVKVLKNMLLSQINIIRTKLANGVID